MSPLDIIQRLATYPVATVYEAAERVGDISPRIRAMWAGIRMVGPAVTVRTSPGDMVPVFRAIDMARQGDILIIDAGDSERSTIWGGTTTAAALAKGIGGVVTNGAIRDLAEIATARFPVFARAVSLRGTTLLRSGAINQPIALGDAVVKPGDVILGDDDGVLVVEADRAEEVLARAVERLALEVSRSERLQRGEPLRAVFNLPHA